MKTEICHDLGGTLRHLQRRLHETYLPLLWEQAGDEKRHVSEVTVSMHGQETS